MTILAATAAWTSPVVLVVIAAQVGAGAPDAPLLVLAAVVAPLAALLRPRAPAAPATRAGAVVAVAVTGLLVLANLLVFAEAAVLLGAARWHGAAAAGAVLALLALARVHARRPAFLLALGLAAVLLPLVALAARSHTAPWTAWTVGASRIALTLGARSAWVTRGERFPRDAVLHFTEGHRVVAMTPGTYRVVERDAGQAVVREWQLDAGETLRLRPGDRLAVHSGARVRFEAGKRVPGVVPSGVAWADPPERRRGERVLDWLGATATLLGGAVALVRPARRVPRGLALAAPALLLAAVLGATGWGVYGATLAPELSAGAALAAPMIGLPAVAAPGTAGRALGVLVCAGLLALLAVAGGSLRDRVTAAAGSRGDLLWVALVAAAALVATVAIDPWAVLATALGLGASAGAAPLLAGGGRPAAAAGAVVGAAAFGALALGGPLLADTLGALAAWPALVAAPLAWGVTTMAARPWNLTGWWR
jgi:hypothetical protein